MINGILPEPDALDQFAGIGDRQGPSRKEIRRRKREDGARGNNLVQPTAGTKQETGSVPCPDGDPYEFPFSD